MIKKIILHFWSMRHQFVRYFITGIIGVALDILSLFLLKQYAHLRPVVAVVINQAVLLNFVFFMNKHWSFKSQGSTHKQVVRFLIICGINYIISVTAMWFFNERMGFNYLLVRTANIAIAVAWNFLLYRYWVYRPEIVPPVEARP
jgi:putative flippase GtrA